MKHAIRYWKDHLWSSFAAPRHKHLFGDVEVYCMFLGYPRSGHTLHGALLNAHPEMLIAHELNALFYVERGISRDQLFSLLWKRDRWFCEQGNRWLEFNYEVPNQWQGKFQKLRVIGDKKGGGTARLLTRSPGALAQLRRIVQVPIKMIHMVRNPFDNIGTMARRRQKALEQSIESYFQMVETNARVMRESKAGEVLTMRNEDFIAAPKERLKELVEFVGLEANETYLKDCASVVFTSPSKSRSKVTWTPELIEKVNSEIRKYPFLDGYTFES